MEYDINKLDKNYDNTNFITNLRVDPPAGCYISSRGWMILNYNIDQAMVILSLIYKYNLSYDPRIMILLCYMDLVKC